MTRNTTIILTTHDLGDVEALCQRIIIIDKGKILFDGDIQKVNALFGAYRTIKLQINEFTPTDPHGAGRQTSKTDSGATTASPSPRRKSSGRM